MLVFLLLYFHCENNATLKHANKMINMNERSTGIDELTCLTPLDASPSNFNWNAIQFGKDINIT